MCQRRSDVWIAMCLFSSSSMSYLEELIVGGLLGEGAAVLDGLLELGGLGGRHFECYLKSGIGERCGCCVVTVFMFLLGEGSKLSSGRRKVGCVMTDVIRTTPATQFAPPTSSHLQQPSSGTRGAGATV